MHRRSVLSTVLALAGVAALPRAALAAAPPLSVVATTGMIADLARSVGGELVAVRALMGPGTDPHGYRATRSDIAAMADADLVLWHGLSLEAQLHDFLDRLATRTPVVALAETLRGDPRLLTDPSYANQADPHVWMDPALWESVAEAAATAIADARPDAAADLAHNLDAFRTEARALDAYARDVLASVPQDRRVLVTAHDAFGYFGRAYGFEVMGIQGISTESEAGLARIGALVDLLVARGIGAVFVESSVSPRNVRALIEGAAARGHAVRIGAELYSDAMGPDGSYEGTWLGMIDHNVTHIAGALGGRVPARGRLGKLAAAS